MVSHNEHEQAEESRHSKTSSDGNGQRHSARAEDAQKSEAAPKRPSRLKRIWNALELDLFTVLLLAKGGLPPALALGLLQVTVIAFHFTTIG